MWNQELLKFYIHKSTGNFFRYQLFPPDHYSCLAYILSVWNIQYCPVNVQQFIPSSNHCGKGRHLVMIVISDNSHVYLWTAYNKQVYLHWYKFTSINFIVLCFTGLHARFSEACQQMINKFKMILILYFVLIRIWFAIMLITALNRRWTDWLNDWLLTDRTFNCMAFPCKFSGFCWYIFKMLDR